MANRKLRLNPPIDMNAVVPAGTVVDLPELRIPLTPAEEKMARLYVLYNNATKAYIEAFGYEGKSRHSAGTMAWAVINKPNVTQKIREIESAAAALIKIDYAAILDHDRQIVEGFKQAERVSRRELICCRYCYGEKHKYQWRDIEEYLEAIQRVNDENGERAMRGQRALSQPSEAGGYGYERGREPNLLCPACEGRGQPVDIISDTASLDGPVRSIVKGIKTTSAGTEVLLHDIDKAKERLLRAGGYFNDDAASVARAAAAGAAAGTAVATVAAATKVQEMTVEEAQRLYLELT